MVEGGGIKDWFTCDYVENMDECIITYFGVVITEGSRSRLPKWYYFDEAELDLITMDITFRNLRIWDDDETPEYKITESHTFNIAIVKE